MKTVLTVDARHFLEEADNLAPSLKELKRLCDCLPNGEIESGIRETVNVMIVQLELLRTRALKLMRG